MIKATVKGESTNVECHGDITEIIADISRIIQGVYGTVMRHDKFIGGFFKYAVEQTVTSPESPLWVLKDEGTGTEVFAAIPKE